LTITESSEMIGMDFIRLQAAGLASQKLTSSENSLSFFIL